MTAEWQSIIDGLKFQNPDSINKNLLLKTLDLDSSYDLTVLDILYAVKILTKDEYLRYLEYLRRRYQNQVTSLTELIEQIKGNISNSKTVSER